MSKKEKQQMPRYCERKEHEKFRSVWLKQRRGVHCEKNGKEDGPGNARPGKTFKQLSLYPKGNRKAIKDCKLRGTWSGLAF